MSKTRSNLRFKEFAKAAAAGAFVGAIALQPIVTNAATGSVHVHAGNATWYVNTHITFSTTSSGWGISSATLHTAAGTRDDAYDGAFSWHVNLTAPGALSPGGYTDPGGVVTTDTSHGTTLNGSVQVLAGLNVTGQMYFSPTKAVVRTMLVLQNPTGAPISAFVGNYSNLGSDSNTTIYNTSSGSAPSFTAADNWFISGQGSAPAFTAPPSGDPVLTVALEDSVASVRGSNFISPVHNGSDKSYFNYSVTVPAGATRRLIIFGQLSDTVANASVDAASFNSTTALRSTDYLYGLTQAQLSEVVNWSFVATPVLTVASGTNPSSYGQSVAFTATFANSSSPTGTVTFCADDATCVAPVASCTATVTGTTASCSMSTLPAGPHSITAHYAGDTFNTAANSAPLTQQVNPASQTITFGAQAPHTFSSGATFALSPLATASSALPVSYASTTPGVCTIVSTTVTLHGAGTCTISASQAGNGNYSAAASVPQNIAIGVSASTIALTASPNPAQAGQTVTLTATVTGFPPTGTVTFYDGGVLLGTGTLSGSSPDLAAFSTASFAAGNHSITASYSGDVNNAASTTLAAVVEAVAAPFTPMPAPTLGRWALLLLGGMIGLVARSYRRAASRP